MFVAFGGGNTEGCGSGCEVAQPVSGKRKSVCAVSAWNAISQGVDKEKLLAMRIEIIKLKAENQKLESELDTLRRQQKGVSDVK